MSCGVEPANPSSNEILPGGVSADVMGSSSDGGAPSDGGSLPGGVSFVAPNAPIDNTVQACPLADLIVHVRQQGVDLAIQNATVAITGPEDSSGTTDSNGKVEFKKIQPGTYVIKARKNALLPDTASSSIELPNGGTKEIVLLLKPIAELHILVGGPYKKDGEEHRYGHTALRIKTDSSDTTYDFGRYGAVSGTFGESGEGILRIWSDFNTYIKGENALKRKTTGFVYAITEIQSKAVNDYFIGLSVAGTNLPGKERIGMKVYKLSTNYHALGPNCTTLSIDGAKQALPKIDLGSDKFNKPADVLSIPERLALGAKGGAPRLFLPANLQKFFESNSSPEKFIRVDTYGGE